MPRPEPYRQLLPDLELSIERYTDTVPADGGWYLLRSGEQVGRYRSLKEAQRAWAEVLAAEDWQPPKRDLDPSEITRRESMERWSRNRAG